MKVAKDLVNYGGRNRKGKMKRNEEDGRLPWQVGFWL